MLTFTCTVVRSGSSATVWSGSAFNCLPAVNEIILRHNDNSNKTCGDDIAAYRIEPDNNNCFTSQLRVTVNSGMNNKTITCTGSGKVGETTLTVISGRFLSCIKLKY